MSSSTVWTKSKNASCYSSKGLASASVDLSVAFPPAGAAKDFSRWGKDPASQKTAYRKLYERTLRSYCPRSEATSLTEEAFSRKFLAVLLKPER
jgi:hypothetical protein